ncbi:unnamed protein product [Rotaria sordida]|uniref:Uncharacterized protein n=1 Tax=Rotaria sordida TaxID=392033 RepID=A0A814M5P9_9BILA|nr:unnamed protein product [Rotaria sordida]CAF3865972.1 unnamed protein product [Rotaria sordida]
MDRTLSSITNKLNDEFDSNKRDQLIIQFLLSEQNLTQQINVLYLHNEVTYKLLQAVDQMYEVVSTSENHYDNLRNCFVLSGSNLNQNYEVLGNEEQ